VDVLDEQEGMNRKSERDRRNGIWEVANSQTRPAGKEPPGTFSLHDIILRHSEDPRHYFLLLRLAIVIKVCVPVLMDTSYLWKRCDWTSLSPLP
jgi:hypothetical protein